jgi:transposase
MDELPIFTAALGIEAPWYIKRVYFEMEDDQSRLFIEVAHKRRTKFEYQGNSYPVYDHQKRRWRHLNFFQHECYLYGDIPRVKTEDGHVRLVDVPWARPGSSFTLLFEQMVLAQIKGGMSARSAGELLGISGKRVFRIVNNCVSTALSNQDLDTVKHLSVDETSSRRGHKYLTIMTDRDAKKVVGVAVGKSKEAFYNALIDMEIRGSDSAEVRSVTMDMSKSYIAGVNETMPQAEIIFDRFHIASKMNEAVDTIRRTDQKHYKELKGSRYLWLKNNASLSEKQRAEVNMLSQAYPNIGEAYRLRELLKQVMDDAIRSSRLTPLNNWIKEALASQLEPIRDFVNMLHQHWYGIKAYFKNVASNAFAERVNLKIQDIKRTAKGYRNIHNFIIMIYFHLGGLDLKTHYK